LPSISGKRFIVYVPFPVVAWLFPHPAAVHYREFRSTHESRRPPIMDLIGTMPRATRCARLHLRFSAASTRRRKAPSGAPTGGGDAKPSSATGSQRQQSTCTQERQCMFVGMFGVLRGFPHLSNDD
jgi:hypothetical protein